MCSWSLSGKATIQIQAVKLWSPTLYHCIIWVSLLSTYFFLLDWTSDSSLLLSSLPPSFSLHLLGCPSKGKSTHLTQGPFPGGARTLACPLLSLYFWSRWRVRPFHTQGKMYLISPSVVTWGPLSFTSSTSFANNSAHWHLQPRLPASMTIGRPAP